MTLNEFKAYVEGLQEGKLDKKQLLVKILEKLETVHEVHRYPYWINTATTDVPWTITYNAGDADSSGAMVLK